MKTHTAFIFVVGLAVIAADSIPDESDSESDIVGGFQAPRHAWPWTAAIYLPMLAQKICGATIVAPQWLVTAGHCFSEYINKEDYVIEIGGYRKDDVVEKHQIADVFIHEKFDQTNYTFNDIALVKLNSSLVDTDHFFESIPLSDFEKYDHPENYTRCVIIGWGADHLKNDPTKEEPKFDLSESLLEGDVSLVDVYECAKKFRPFEIDPNTQVCAGGKGVGTCYGDSGSSLQCFLDEKKHWYLVGITSFGRPCAREGVPDVYTSVAAFKDWIVETIEKNSAQASTTTEQTTTNAY